MPMAESNLSQSAQEYMKRLPTLTTALRDQGLVSKINDVMRHNPNLTYEQVVELILDFDEVNTTCIAAALKNGDITAESILTNYGRKFTTQVQQIGKKIAAESPQQQNNFYVQITEIQPGKRATVEESISNLTSYELLDAKVILKTLPAIIDAGLTADQAENLRLELNKAGATVTVEHKS